MRLDPVFVLSATRLFRFMVVWAFLCLGTRVKASEFDLALGLGTGWQQQKAYGSKAFDKRYFELPVLGYVPTYGDIYFRPGLRLFTSQAQQEMPRAVQVRETEIGYLLDFGFSYDWYVLPVISYAFGSTEQTVKLVTNGDVAVPVNKVSTKESLKTSIVHFGVGIPMFHGRIVVEPYLRSISIERDSRTTFAYGFELTYALFATGGDVSRQETPDAEYSPELPEANPGKTEPVPRDSSASLKKAPPKVKPTKKKVS